MSPTPITATAAAPEIQSWLHASRNDQAVVELDTNGDGIVVKSGPNADMTNGQLAVTGVNVAYVLMKHNLNERSPWNETADLWYSADPNIVNTYGYIVVSSVARGIQIQAFEKNNATPIVDKFIFSE